MRMMSLVVRGVGPMPASDYRWQRWTELEERLFKIAVPMMKRKVKLAGVTKHYPDLQPVDDDEKNDCYQLPWEQGLLKWVGERVYPLSNGNIQLPNKDGEQWIDDLYLLVYRRQLQNRRLLIPFRGWMIDPLLLYHNDKFNELCLRCIHSSIKNIWNHHFPLDQTIPQSEIVGGDVGAERYRIKDAFLGYTMERWLKEHGDSSLYPPCQRKALRQLQHQHIVHEQRLFIVQTAKARISFGQGLMFMSALFNATAYQDGLAYGMRTDRERAISWRSVAKTLSSVGKSYNVGCDRVIAMGFCHWSLAEGAPKKRGRGGGGRGGGGGGGSGEGTADIEELAILVRSYLDKDDRMVADTARELSRMKKVSERWKNREKALCRCLASRLGGHLSGMAAAAGQIPAVSPIMFQEHLIKSRNVGRQPVEIKYDEIYGPVK